MHNAAIAALRLHYAYIPFSVQPDDIGPAISSLRALGIIGVNLTIPHKVRALPFLDEIAPDAKAVGAVNTVLNDGGRLIGHNTDGEGFFAPLLARGFRASGKKAVVLGAGGAARSVVFRLAQEGADVAIANRTAERAAHLAADANNMCGRHCATTIVLDDAAGLVKAMAGAELLVNTTSVGMYPKTEEVPPIPAGSIHPEMLVYDLVYNPLRTRLLETAEQAGADTLDGLQMLVHQGAASFRIWTGIDPPIDTMIAAAREALDCRE